MNKARKPHIETGIITPIRKTKSSFYPFDQLEVCSIEDGKFSGPCIYIGIWSRKKTLAVGAAIYEWENENPGKDLIQRKCADDIIRVYRIK